MTRPRGNSSAGFSLVEVLCALLILSVGLAGMTTAIATALRSTRDAEFQSRAALFASGVIETLRAEGFLTDGESEGGCGEGLEGYRWRLSLVPSDLEGLHEVTVSIHGEDSAPSLFELKTLLFEAPTASLKADQEDDRRQRQLERRRR
jgi:prepilin-type N-terminal cleavage/methylation domain-containing protein